MSGRQVLLLLATILLCGCRSEEDDSLAKRAGDTVGQTVTEFVSGVGSGVDRGMEVDVELSEKLTARGVSKTVSKQLGIDRPGEKGISVYLLAKDPVNASLIAKAFNAEGQEIGRAVVDVTFASDDAQYVTFKFDPQMDTQAVKKYVIDIREQPASTAPALQHPAGETGK